MKNSVNMLRKSPHLWVDELHTFRRAHQDPALSKLEQAKEIQDKNDSEHDHHGD